MSDPIIQRVSQHAVEKAGQQGGPQPLAKVDPDDQAKFDEALNRPDHNEGAQQPGEVNAADGGMGHDLLKQVNEVDRSYHEATQRAEARLSTPAEDVSPMDLLSTQMEMMKTEATLEFTTKAADKVSTDIQTLANRQN